MKHELGELLLEMGRTVRRAVLTKIGSASDARPVAHEGGDTIYEIDRRVEPLILQQLEDWPAAAKPILVIAEGFGQTGRVRVGRPDEAVKHRLLIDPIDGTRALMYDKRSAWFLAALSPERGDGTRISDSIATAMVELPTTKQTLCDEFLSVVGAPLRAQRVDIIGAAATPLTVAPSAEEDLRHGFGHVASFFPGTKQLAAELLEHIAAETLGAIGPGDAVLFDDQYISTGGQFVELMMGRDRFGCDLRPLFFDILAKRAGTATTRGITCHPYDIAGLRVAEEAGVILTDGFGKSLDAMLTTSSEVHWCGYANPSLRAKIEPVVQHWLATRL